jgi:hypothetical protein
MPPGLASLGDHRVAARSLEKVRFVDRGRVAEHQRHRLDPREQRRRGSPKWKLTISGRTASTASHSAASNGRRSGCPAIGRRHAFACIKGRERVPPCAVVGRIIERRGRRN